MTIVEILGIIFDLGGVLVRDSRPIVFDHISLKLGVSVPTLERVMYQETPKLQRGEETTLEFWYRMCKRLHVRRLPDDELLTLLTAVYTAETVEPMHETLALVKRLKAQGYPLGVISNTIPEHMAVHRDQGVFNDMDAVILSYEVGLRKPEKAIFELGARSLNIPLRNLLFIDNEMRWVNAAIASGCRSLRFDSAKDVEEKMRRIGVRV